MADTADFDLNAVIDGQPIRLSTVIFLAIATLTLVSDGFDIAAIGYVGPELVKAWHITRSQLVPVFSAGIIGLLVGAPLLGYVGDRFGRKRGILLGLALFGGLTLVTATATSLPEFIVLRFLTGIGLGGVIPNLIALTAEAAPKRVRGRFIVIVNFGVPAGISLPGLVAAVLVPSHGWPVLMVVGGLLPIAIGLLSLWLLPESIKYLANREGRAAEVRRLASAMRPDLTIGPDDRFSLPVTTAAIDRSPRQLFSKGLFLITVTLWIALAANQMANFFALSWLPTLLQSAGATTAQAGVNASLFPMGGMVGGFCLLFLIDRFGAISLVALFVAGAPLVAAIGVGGLPPAAAGAIIAGSGFCVTGINFGMGAILGTVYPTRIRSVGTGLAQAAGRLGSLAAPLIGGLLLELQLPVQKLLFAPAVSLLIGAAACLTLTVVCAKRLGGYHLDEVGAGSAVGAESSRSVMATVATSTQP